MRTAEFLMLILTAAAVVFAWPPFADSQCRDHQRFCSSSETEQHPSPDEIAWGEAERMATRVAYEVFLSRYPDSQHAQTARDKIAFLDVEQGDEPLPSPEWARSIEPGQTRCVGRIGGDEEVCLHRPRNHPDRLVRVSRPSRDPDRRSTQGPDVLLGTETWVRTGSIQVPVEEAGGACTPGERTYVNGVMRVCTGQVQVPTGRECRVNSRTGERQCRSIGPR